LRETHPLLICSLFGCAYAELRFFSIQIDIGVSDDVQSVELLIFVTVEMVVVEHSLGYISQYFEEFTAANVFEMGKCSF
jgi:hypothetical protein